jgi:hypothetical protein
MGKYIPVDPEKWAAMVIAQSDLVRYKEICDELDAECTRLKAEVERLTKQVERLIVSLQKSHDEHGEALYKLKYKNERQTPRKKRSS